MDFFEYEAAVAPLAVYPGQGTVHGLAYAALGVAGESGEFADKVKKVLRDSGGEITPERREAMIKELGDVLWYVMASAWELGTNLDGVARANVEKLTDRRSRGMTHGDGDNR